MIDSHLSRRNSRFSVHIKSNKVKGKLKIEEHQLNCSPRKTLLLSTIEIPPRNSSLESCLRDSSMLWTPAISIRTDQPFDLKIATYADLSHLIRLGNDKTK